LNVGVVVVEVEARVVPMVVVVEEVLVVPML